MAAPTVPSIVEPVEGGEADLDVSWTITSTDPDLTDVTIVVDWGDDTTPTSGASGDEFVHIYHRPGRYTPTITATTADDDTTTTTVGPIIIDPPMWVSDGPCEPPFTVDDIPCEVPDDSPVTAEEATDAAIRWMYDIMCGRFTGTCTSLVRPFIDGRCAPWRSSDNKLDLTRFVRGPITKIVEVVVNGVPIDPQYYRLENRKRIVAQTGWTGGSSPLIPWPPQDTDRPIGADDTWWTEVEHGRAWPEPVILASRRLACEIIAQVNNEECELPDNATSITREGITVNLAAREDGKVGVGFIDTVIDLYPCRGSGPRRMHDALAPRAAVYPYPPETP